MSLLNPLHVPHVYSSTYICTCARHVHKSHVDLNKEVRVFFLGDPRRLHFLFHPSLFLLFLPCSLFLPFPHPLRHYHIW